ncbi:hypothetical protein [Aquibacillus sediminis]|nr:hypothetical protein [Aquibacillus sediminis]
MKQQPKRGAMGIKVTGLLLNALIIGSLIAGLTSGFKITGTGGL